MITRNGDKTKSVKYKYGGIFNIIINVLIYSSYELQVYRTTRLHLVLIATLAVFLPLNT